MGVPSLLLVPGAWHKPGHLQPLADELHDVDVRTVALTSSGDDPAALGDMYSDAAAIKSAVAAIDGPVAVVAHSYGGIPATQALGAADNVVRIVYLAAFQLDAGESLLSSIGDSPASPWWKVHRQDGIAGYTEVVTPVDVFYGDVDPEVARQAAAQLGYQSYLVTTQELTEVAWRTIPARTSSARTTTRFPPSHKSSSRGVRSGSGV